MNPGCFRDVVQSISSTKNVRGCDPIRSVTPQSDRLVTPGMQELHKLQAPRSQASRLPL
jgi:hypothetical protein